MVVLIAASPTVEVWSYHIEGDGIAAPLAGRAGDAARGAKIMSARQISTCALCHAGPFADPLLSGNIGPSLTGVASRLSDAQIRLRVVDPRRVDPETVMPAFYRTDGFIRASKASQGRPILSAEQIEDVVAYLDTLASP